MFAIIRLCLGTITRFFFSRRSKADAERMTNFESTFNVGSGLVNAIGTGEIGGAAKDAGLTVAGMATAPCVQ
jgi:hypothetical protein